MEIKQIKKRFDIGTRLEFMYLFVLALYLIRQFFDTTMFSISWPGYYEKLVRVLAFCVVFLKAGYGEQREDHRWFFCVLTGAAFALSWISTGYEFLLDIGILVIGAKDIPYKKILKVYIWCGTVVLATAMLGALTGCIKDLLYPMEPGQYRHSFGIVFPTDFAAHIVFMFLAIWVTYEQIPLHCMMALGIILDVFIYRYCYAKCSAIVMTAAIAGIFYEYLEGKIRENKITDRLKKVVDACLISAFPVLAAGTCLGMVCYNESNLVLERINSAVTGRLELAEQAFKKYGIKLFGTPFEMIGGGGSTTARLEYNFVDISYCMILLRYGLLLLLTIVVLNTGMAVKAKKVKNEKVLIALALVAAHSAVEHHLTEPGYNIFLLLTFSCVDAGVTADIPERQRKQNKICEGYYIGLTVLGVIILPYAVSYGRTVVSVLGLYENWRHKYFILVVAVGIIGTVLIVQTAKSSILEWEQTRSWSPRKRNLLVGEIVLSVVGISAGMYLVSGYENSMVHSMDAGIQLVKELKNTESFQGKIYADDYPELYIREAGAVKRRILPGESAWGEDGVVLITRKEKELQRLLQEGYRFAELSDTECVYTNSKEAIQLLEQNGIEVNHYYSVKSSADMQKMAEANGLQYDENAGVLIEGSTHSMIHGPWVTLYKGRLKVTYRMRLQSTSVEQGAVATVRISSNSGQIIYKQEVVDRSLFDETGTYDYTIEADIIDAEGYEFLVFAEDDTDLWIENILYGKIKAKPELLLKKPHGKEMLM